MEDGKVFVRSDVTEKESGGHGWKEILCEKAVRKTLEEVSQKEDKTLLSINSFAPSESTWAVRFNPRQAEIELRNPKNEIISKFGKFVTDESEDCTEEEGEEEAVESPADEDSGDFSMEESIIEQTGGVHTMWSSQEKWTQVCPGGVAFTAKTLPSVWIEPPESLRILLEYAALAMADRRSEWRAEILDVMISRNR